MHSEKDKSKAMQIAVAVEGVSSVSIKKESDQIEVIGEGVDSVSLAKLLRKKFCFADIVSVQEVKPPESPDRCTHAPPPCNNVPPPPPPLPPPYWGCQVYDVGGHPNCSNM